MSIKLEMAFQPEMTFRTEVVFQPVMVIWQEIAFKPEIAKSQNQLYFGQKLLFC